MFRYNEIQVQHYCDNEQTVYGFRILGGSKAWGTILNGKQCTAHQCITAVHYLEKKPRAQSWHLYQGIVHYYINVFTNMSKAAWWGHWSVTQQAFADYLINRCCIQRCTAALLLDVHSSLLQAHIQAPKHMLGFHMHVQMGSDSMTQSHICTGSRGTHARTLRLYKLRQTQNQGFPSFQFHICFQEKFKTRQSSTEIQTTTPLRPT